VYIAVCADLSPQQQMVQVAHAAQECGLYLSTAAPDSDFIVICSVPDEAALLAEAARHDLARIRVIREPDLGHRATAMASAPVIGKDRKPFRRWKLWLPSGIGGKPGETVDAGVAAEPTRRSEAVNGACPAAQEEVP
jgi:hypothetical protein